MPPKVVPVVVELLSVPVVVDGVVSLSRLYFFIMSLRDVLVPVVGEAFGSAAGAKGDELLLLGIGTSGMPGFPLSGELIDGVVCEGDSPVRPASLS